MSLVAYRKEYDESLAEGFHIGTYRGNPIAMAAGTASINYIKKHNVLERVQRSGQKIKGEFERVMRSSAHIGDVRGEGFMIGNEVVDTKAGKKPSKQLAQKFRKTMFENGLLMHTSGHYGNVLRFMAPLTIEDGLLERGMEIYERAVRTGRTDSGRP